MVVGIWSSSATTTAPLIAMLLTGVQNQINDFTNSAKTAGFISSLTALPSPTIAFSGVNVNTNQAWYGIY